MTDLQSHAQDIDVMTVLENLSFIECANEAIHQYTDWDREIALWNVTFTLDNVCDVGALVSKIDMLDNAQCEGIEPEGQVSVHPDGKVSLMIETGPGVDDGN